MATLPVDALIVALLLTVPLLVQVCCLVDFRRETDLEMELIFSLMAEPRRRR